MNIFSNLPFFNKPADESEAELTKDEIAAEEKADRIAFHRTHVRNGPTSFKYLSAGQQRRARVRAEQREVKKNYRREVKNYFERQRLGASVRAHLQIAGVIPFIDGSEAPVHDQIASTGWLVQRFGTEVEVDGQGTGHVSYREADVVDAMRRAAQFVGAAFGYTPPVPADFVPAISLAEDADA